jgi:hypothetical protein
MNQLFINYVLINQVVFAELLFLHGYLQWPWGMWTGELPSSIFILGVELTLRKTM